MTSMKLGVSKNNDKKMAIPGLGPTLVEQAYEVILDAICGGRLPPGERLNQDELASRMNISRQPVTQALSILRAQGFARDTGRRGLIVAPIERNFFRSIYQLREAIDLLAARLAAQQPILTGISEQEKLLEVGCVALAGDIEPLITYDMQFHMWIYERVGNPLIVGTMRLYWNHLRRAMGEVLRPTSGRQQVWDEHRAIFEAIVQHNADLAGNLALRHVKDAAERVADSIPE